MFSVVTASLEPSPPRGSLLPVTGEEAHCRRHPCPLQASWPLVGGGYGGDVMAMVEVS